VVPGDGQGGEINPVWFLGLIHAAMVSFRHRGIFLNFETFSKIPRYSNN